MDKKEFLKTFGKTTFIEHLNEAQQKELFGVVKKFCLSKEKVERIIYGYIGEHKSGIRFENPINPLKLLKVLGLE